MKEQCAFFTKFWVTNLILAPFLSFRSKKHYNCIVWSITIVVAITLASIMVYLIKTLGMLSFFDREFVVYLTPPIAEIIWVKNVREIVACGFLMKLLKKCILKIWKKLWMPFGSYLLNSTANPAHFHSNWAGLAVLFST